MRVVIFVASGCDVVLAAGGGVLKFICISNMYVPLPPF